MKNCHECGLEKIVPNVLALDRASKNSYLGMEVGVNADPDAFIFTERKYSGVSAKVCADCGFIAFYSDEPKLLWQAYKNSQKDV